MDLCSQTQTWDTNPASSPPSKNLLITLFVYLMHTVLYTGFEAGDKAIISLGALECEPVFIFWFPILFLTFQLKLILKSFLQDVSIFVVTTVTYMI